VLHEIECFTVAAAHADLLCRRSLSAPFTRCQLVLTLCAWPACRTRLSFVDARDYGGFQTGAKALLPEHLDYPLGYRHMCHFMSMLWFSALRQYEYALRVDEDVCVTRFPDEMLFAALSSDCAERSVRTHAHRFEHPTNFCFRVCFSYHRCLRPGNSRVSR
jgi:hypothetical protein